METVTYGPDPGLPTPVSFGLLLPWWSSSLNTFALVFSWLSSSGHSSPAHVPLPQKKRRHHTRPPCLIPVQITGVFLACLWCVLFPQIPTPNQDSSSMRAETFSILFIAVPAKSQTQPSLQLMLKMNKCHTNEGQACDPCVTPEHFWLRLWDAWSRISLSSLCLHFLIHALHSITRYCRLHLHTYPGLLSLIRPHKRHSTGTDPVSISYLIT